MAKVSNVTMGDVAKEAGVSRTTVSLALRGHKRISEATRKKIEAAAEKIGYVPNPYLSVLGAQIRASKSKGLQAQIAYLSYGPIRNCESGQLEGLSFNEEHYFGIVNRCKQLGYGIEPVFLDKSKLSAKRLNQILASRGIMGLVMHRQFNKSEDWKLDWDKYAVCAIGSSNFKDCFHSVDCNRHDGMMQLINHVHQLGYKRLGLVLWEEQDRYNQHAIRMVVSDYQLRIAQDDRVPPLVAKEITKENLSRWIKEYSPDLVIGGTNNIYEMLVERGLRIPEDIGFVRPQLTVEGLPMSGVRYDQVSMGAAAVDIIVGQILGNETGVPATPKRMIISGKWRDGETTRRLGKSRRKPLYPTLH